MKKIFSLIIITIFSFFCLGNLFANADNTKDYLILVYMNGSNLESDRGQATKAINEMLKVSGDEKFPGTFIVETGGTKTWHLNELANTKNRRFVIEDGKIQQMTELPDNSMGNSDNFKEFLSYGISKPAKHYILIFWNHGEGSLKGFGFDELNKNDTLTLKEMDNAFKGTGIKQKFDLIGFDTCLMSTIETAQMLSPYGNYMLASQETEKQGGWNYSVFATLAQKDITIEKLAKSILFIGVIVTGIAYTLQIFGHKATKPILATLILSSEAIFAVIGGMLILNETLTINEWFGCFVMFIGIVISQIPNKVLKETVR